MFLSIALFPRASYTPGEVADHFVQTKDSGLAMEWTRGWRFGVAENILGWDLTTDCQGMVRRIDERRMGLERGGKMGTGAAALRADNVLARTIVARIGQGHAVALRGRARGCRTTGMFTGLVHGHFVGDFGGRMTDGGLRKGENRLRWQRPHEGQRQQGGDPFGPKSNHVFN
jgi:hypothetical protein